MLGVRELRKNSEMKVQMIPIGMLEIDNQNMRVSTTNIDELEDSIERYGILNPLVARANGGKFGVVAGGRRLVASRTVGLKKLPVIVRKMTDEQAFIMSVTENIHRENLSPAETAKFYVMAVKRFGSGQKAAKQLGVSRTRVNDYLHVARMVDLVEARGGGVEMVVRPVEARIISSAGQKLFPGDPDKQVKLFESLKKKRRGEILAIIDRLKEERARNPRAFSKKSVKQLLKKKTGSYLNVQARFGARVSRGFRKAAKERDMTDTELIGIAMEQWLKEEGYL